MATWWNAPLIIQTTLKIRTNNQEIHSHPSHKHTTRLAMVHLIPPSYIPDLNPGHFSPSTPPPPFPNPLFLQSPYCGNWEPSLALSLTPLVPPTSAHPPSCQGLASHVHHWVMDGAEGHHPTLQSSLIPSAMQTPPNHSRGWHKWNYTLSQDDVEKNCAFLEIKNLFPRDNKSYVKSCQALRHFWHFLLWRICRSASWWFYLFFDISHWGWRETCETCNSGF